MRQMISNGDSWVLVRDSEPETCAPYPAETHADGRINAGYVPLVVQPSLIDRLPEVVAFPELGELLRAINSARGQFMTTCCDCGVHPFAKDKEKSFAGALVYIVRRKVVENKSECDWLKFATAFCSRLPSDPRFRFRVEVRPLDHLYGEEGCLALKVDFGAIGETPQIAWGHAREMPALIASLIEGLEAGAESWPGLDRLD